MVVEGQPQAALRLAWPVGGEQAGPAEPVVELVGHVRGHEAAVVVAATELGALVPAGRSRVGRRCRHAVEAGRVADDVELVHGDLAAGVEPVITLGDDGSPRTSAGDHGEDGKP